MEKRKVFIAIHQLNLGGAQKALISALNAIDYSENQVTLYVRKERLDLLPQVNPNVTSIIINKDHTKYYRMPYPVLLYFGSKINDLMKRSNKTIDEKLTNYIVKKQIEFEKSNYFREDNCYDVAISYIQGYTAKSVAENINATRKVMFYHDSTDSLHELHAELMQRYDKVYCVSKGALQAVQGFYPQFADKIDYLENYVDAEIVRRKANEFVPDYPKNKLILCACGRMTPVKGFDLAVEAAEILKSQGLDFKWYFVGDGIDRQKIEQLIINKHLSEVIEITGLQNNPYPFIKNCDIYVQPSYEESYGLTLIEAQILQKLIVSTMTLGASNIVHDESDGVLAYTSADSVAQKILFLLQEKQLQKKIMDNLERKVFFSDYQRFRREWKQLLEG